MDKKALAGFLGVWVLLLFVPTLIDVVGFGVYYLVFLYSLSFWIIQSTSWNIFCGYAGYISFGQGAFYGVGVYTTAILTARYEFEFLATLPLAALVSAVLGALLGVVVFRLRKLAGEFFALITFLITFVIRDLFNNFAIFDGGQGIRIGTVIYPPFLGPVPEMLFTVGITLMMIALFVAYWIQHSKFGKGLNAIRDDEDVAEGLGVPTFRYKMAAWTISCALAGASGGLHAIQMNYVSIPATFTLLVPLYVIVISMLGGMSHWQGPVFGSVVIYFMFERLSSGGWGQLNEVITALLLIGITMWVREGLYEKVTRYLYTSILVFLIVFGGVWVLGIFEVGLSLIATALFLTVVYMFLPGRFHNEVRSLVGLDRKVANP